MTNEKAKLRFVGTAKGTIFVGHICDECIYNRGAFSSFGVNPSNCFFKETEKCLHGSPFYVFIKRDTSSVAVFSKVRVPFDTPKTNKTIIQSLKSDLIKAIAGLQAKSRGVLQARYGTTEKNSFFDVENVLFYNIGTTHFNSLAENGVSFSAISGKEIEVLHKKYNIPCEYTHYYEYSIVSNLKTKNFNTPLATWDNIPLKCLGVKPATVWEAIKKEKTKIQILDEINTDNRDTFAIVLDIEKPKDSRFYIMTAMKPLLDGLICAFHSSSFSEKEIQNFSKILNVPKEYVTDDTINALGNRKGKFLQDYRNNVKWNPADDLCDYVFIRVKEGEKWTLSGTLYSSVKCPHCGKGNVSQLLWGMPAFSKELLWDLSTGKIKLAGCCVHENHPNYFCRWCKKMF